MRDLHRYVVASDLVVTKPGALSTYEAHACRVPVLLAGTWAGLRLYGKLDEAGFRKVVLVLLLISGCALLY